MGMLKLSTASGGSITLDPTNTASNLTITVPASTATMAINGPAFSAYQSSAQTVSNNTNTKIQFQTEEFDTNSCFDNSTNYRFTPTVAGYYQVNGRVEYAAGGPYTYCTIYKNGSFFKPGAVSNATGTYACTVSALVYLNGSTDYIELYSQQVSGGSTTVSTGSPATYFQASMVRAA